MDGGMDGDPATQAPKPPRHPSSPAEFAAEAKHLAWAPCLCPEELSSADGRRVQGQQGRAGPSRSVIEGHGRHSQAANAELSSSLCVLATLPDDLVTRARRRRVARARLTACPHTRNQARPQKLGASVKEARREATSVTILERERRRSTSASTNSSGASSPFLFMAVALWRTHRTGSYVPFGWIRRPSSPRPPAPASAQVMAGDPRSSGSSTGSRRLDGQRASLRRRLSA